MNVLSFAIVYFNWKLAGGHQKGETFGMVEMLELLIKNVHKWDVMIQNIPGFEKGTKKYLKLFPNGPEPCFPGSIMSRINAVYVLSNSLAFYSAEPEISQIKLLVDDFYLDLDAARDTQEGAKGISKELSKGVNMQRILVAEGQYSSLGMLMNKFSAQPELIGAFFELNILRNSSQVRFTGTVGAAKNAAVIIHTFYPDDEITLEVTNANSNAPATELSFYLATTPNGTDSTPVVIPANVAKAYIDVSAFGITNYPQHRYLTAVNGTPFDLQYVLELL